MDFYTLKEKQTNKNLQNYNNKKKNICGLDVKI